MPYSGRSAAEAFLFDCLNDPASVLITLGQYSSSVFLGEDKPRHDSKPTSLLPRSSTSFCYQFHLNCAAKKTNAAPARPAGRDPCQANIVLWLLGRVDAAQHRHMRDNWLEVTTTCIFLQLSASRYAPSITHMQYLLHLN